jgi:hypothetical protein
MAVQGALFAVVGVGDRGANTVAVDERREYPAIEDAGPTDVVRFGSPGAQTPVIGPVALDAQTARVVRTAAPAWLIGQLVLYRCCQAGSFI